MKTLSSHAATAAAIRKELKAEFPGIKFSVKSESYAGGNSVSIKWEDGVTTKEVDAVVNKYQYGSFNGMEDIYENTNNRDDIPQVKYVMTERTISDETRAILMPHAEKFYNEYPDPGCHNVNNFLYRVFYQNAIPVGAKVTGLAYNDESSNIRDLIVITFEQPESSNIEIVDYSEKAIAVIGDTKPLKDVLKSLGGKFNFRLKCGAGWIFPKTKIDEVRAAI